MPIETLNFIWFGVLNAPADATSFMTGLAIFIANGLLYVLLGLLIFLWCYGDLELKERAFKAVILTVISLSLGYFVSLIYPHPRPFVIDIGRTLIEHRPTASFPSNHMLIFSTIALSYLFSGRKLAGGILLGLAFLVAWSRIYVGVHFPLDMLGAFLLAMMVNLMGVYLWRRYRDIFMQIALKIYHHLAKPLLSRGLVK